MNDNISNKRRYSFEIITSIVLLVSILAVYWQVRTFDYISFDDYMYVRDNPHVTQGLTLQNIRWAFIAMYAGNWHPLTWLSHMTDWEIFGSNPGMFHLTNVFIHAMNTILLFYCLRRMTGSLGKSAVVAALFGLHPLHVESVAWISERKDVLSSFFWILTMLSYLRYVERRSYARYSVVAVCYVMGLMAKPMLVTMPFVLLLLDFWPLGRSELITFHGQGVSTGENIRQGVRWNGLLTLIREKVPLFLLAGTASVITIMAQKGSGAISNLEIIPLYIRIENAIISYCIYMEKMIWPLHLAVFYPFPRMISFPAVAMSLALLMVITWVALSNSNRFPFFVTGWLWFLGTLVPVIGLIQVGSQSMADRYTYVPFIGISIIVVWGLPQLFTKWKARKYILSGMFCAIVPLLMWSTWLQTGYWKDNISLFSHAINVTQDNYLAHNSLGVAHCDRGEFDEGKIQYLEAIRINPEHVQAHNNLGAVLVKEGNYVGSIDHFRKALHIDPYFANAHYNLGIALYSLGNVDGAIREYRTVLQLNPEHPGALQNIRIALVRQRQTKTALTRLNEALKTEPGDFSIHLKLAELYQGEGQKKEAILHYENALSINPGLAKALHGLAVLYGEGGEYDKALSTLQKMVKLTPDDPDVYYNIACIYSKQGRVEDALKWLSGAVEKGFNNSKLLKIDPDLENIRGTAFYKQIISQGNR